MSLFWTTDEDGETVHRLQREWDGNKGAWREWGRYTSEADFWQVSLGATWSRWGLGVDGDWAHQWGWAGCRVPYRNQSLTLTVGPWYVGWMRHKPSRSALTASSESGASRG